MKIRKAAALLLLALTFIASMGSQLMANDSSNQIIIPFKRFGLEWSTKLPDQVDLLRIWYSLDGGQTWDLYSETDNPSSPAPIKVSEDGVYGIYTQARDASGLEEASPIPGTPPKIIAIIDTKKPALVLVSPNSSETFSNTQDMRIEWNSSDINFGPKPISLYYSVDGGGSWNVIQKDIPNTGTYIWKLPADSSQYYKIKIVAADLAGNEAEDSSDSNFTVDGKAPVTRVVSPREAKSPVFDVAYNASDIGGAGIAKVQIFYQMNDSKEWHLYGEDQDLKSPFRFEAKRGGKYGFKLVATDRVGNSEAKPDVNTRPDLWCLMDSVNPSVKLTSFRGSIQPAGGGTTRKVSWVATDNNMAQNPITIELSLDDGQTWNHVVVSDYKNSGEYPWRVPANVDHKRARLRVTALDVLGNKGFDISDPFVIDGTPPETRLRIVTWDEDTADAMKSRIPVKLSSAIKTPPKKSASDYLKSASVALETGDLRTAEEMGSRALKADQNNYLIHTFFGQLNFNKKDYQKSAKSYRRAIELNPNYQSSRIGLGACYFTMSRGATSQGDTKDLYKKAVLQYESAISIAPDIWDEYFNLGYIYAVLQRYDDAIDALNKAVKLKDDNGEAFWFLGQVYQKKGDETLALKSYKAAANAFEPNSVMRHKADDKVRQLQSK
ncbi:MAG: tetratricopeptide repeat protein [Planctomycetes bacterium]|nr:tetratricopeptide repeat protein [Planctomycetota bacterium]